LTCNYRHIFEYPTLGLSALRRSVVNSARGSVYRSASERTYVTLLSVAEANAILGREGENKIHELWSAIHMTAFMKIKKKPHNY